MPRAKQEEMPIEGPGVSVPRYRDIDRLADEFHELLTERAETSEKIGTVEKKILEKMAEKGLTTYKYRDQQVIFKAGKSHIKIKTIKADADKAELEEAPPTE